MIILIVTPTRNVESFLDETIFSVISQVGDFSLHYHIQDSQSSDGTLEIIKKWEYLLSDSSSLHYRSNISFSWISENDVGMYDAINRGFDQLLKHASQFHTAPINSDQVVMGWINGDDLLASGSLQTIVQFFQAHNYQWVTGIPSLIRQDSALMDLRDGPWGFSKDLLMAGVYDGRRLDFVQQEGTFWRQTLWEKAGPLDTRLRYAGDWDLWRRFAHHSELVTIRAVLGLHRRRQGQLSSSMERYYQEVDAILSRMNKTSFDEQSNSSNKIYFVLTGRWNNDNSQWQVDKQEITGTFIIEDPFWLQAEAKLAHHGTLRSDLKNALRNFDATLKNTLNPTKVILRESSQPLNSHALEDS